MRRIDEPVESLAGPSGVTSAPLAFRWRGRRYVVGTVLAHWVETGAWWRPAPAGKAQTDAAADPGPADPERLLWRVEACRGSQTGVFDLCCESPGDGQ
jgi:hypothetical protein